MHAPAYDMKFKPLMLKQLILDCDITQSRLSEYAECSRALINIVVNRGYFPARGQELKAKLEQFITTQPSAMKWLACRGIKPEEVWLPLGKDMKNTMPKRGNPVRPVSIGNPADIKEKEASMLNSEAMKHFKIFRNPFMNDIRDMQDIFMSEEHRYIEAAMLDSARHGGFIAVIGEVGSGKSVIRRKVVSELAQDDNSRVIYVRMIDKTRVTAASICDAIILDLSDETPRQRLEQKSRQVEQLLISRSKAGCHICLMVEEAHDLPVRVLKLLKRFYEIEDGYKKCLGIVLIGQPELGSLFNEADHYDMREVIRRCLVAYIRGLDDNLKPYLELKFKRATADLSKIVSDEAIEELSRRLSERDGRGKIVSNAYPLTVNNYITRAMNLACDMGETLVTGDVIRALQ